MPRAPSLPSDYITADCAKGSKTKSISSVKDRTSGQNITILQTHGPVLKAVIVADWIYPAQLQFGPHSLFMSCFPGKHFMRTNEPTY